MKKRRVLSRHSMKRNSADTRKRIMEAAMNEFSTYGFAGARVDRIASVANCNKQAIYAYYESKDKLCEEVYKEYIILITKSVEMDVDDLPSYFVAIFRKYREIPNLIRITFWIRLENLKLQSLQILVNFNKKRLKLIEKAQQQGKITDKFSPSDLLRLMVTVSMYHFVSAKESVGVQNDEDTYDDTIREAIKRLIQV